MKMPSVGLSERAGMQHAGRDREPGRASRVFARPSSTLGWSAAAAMAVSIGLVFLINLTASQGPGSEPSWRRAVFLVVVLGLFASGGLGLVAVLRRHERFSPS